MRYQMIQQHPLSLSCREIVKYFDQSRRDPRLMEIMTEYLRDFWWVHDSHELNRAAQKSRFPFMIKASLVLILEYCKISDDIKINFANWFQVVVRGLQDPPPQLIYVGVFPIGSNALQDEVREALPCLLRHNLILKDLPFNKGQPGVLKSEQSLPENRIDELDLIKLKWVQKIKNVKSQFKLKNEELILLSGINRVFLSKILNHKFDAISADYLKARVEQLSRAKVPF